ncbi:Moulting cycle MLT-10-like protein family-containing protein [Strongyloides ratti]|uniref:Moulting cycle MLT-10-like protein family-containing protein n=1 Tax=Strongyloides ratti TaxID=34506 RepID=A0A090KU55_STRRB|nr:Moulting cycle MLT-10-like protein family-containing protein [Strongyloides ratti]CEF60951.1 Moulting cycle MLT-10-like protein family-containing protein [Strongyloides ratti]
MGKDLINKMNSIKEKVAFLQCLEKIDYNNQIPKYPAQCIILAKDKKLTKIGNRNKRQSYRFREMYHIQRENISNYNVIKKDIINELKTKDSEDSFFRKIVRFFTNLFTFNSPKKEVKKKKTWKETYQKIKMLNNIIKGKNINTENLYKRVFDYVSEDQPEYLIRYVRSTTPSKPLELQFDDLIYTLRKHYSGKETPSILSPKFASILPSNIRNRESKNSFLSPNLFPLYHDEEDPNSKNDILPLPKVMNELGMDDKDKEAVLEMVMDVTGADSIIEDVTNILKDNGFEDDINKITDFVSITFKNIQKTFSFRQKRDMESLKYGFLTSSQLEILFGINGPYKTKRSNFPFSIAEYKKMTIVDKKRALWESIRKISELPDPIAKNRGGSRFLSRRFKRTLILKHDHTTLSPFAFSPSINTFTLLGPTTLSPSLFSPSIIAPYLLSPPVLSPQVGNPMIFSPYVLGPNVLSAAVFNAYVFSPYVLSPNVINPYVLSPVILSPFVLCPDVLSPTVLSGVVLSPSVLSPSVYTDTILAANVLSPTFLS